MFDKNEGMKTTQVDPDKIVCRTCAFKNGGGYKIVGFSPHYTKSVCIKYPFPQSKPLTVLFEGADCIFYEEERYGKYN